MRIRLLNGLVIKLIENPWKIAREGLSDADRGNQEITLESMADYYSNLF